MHIDGSCHCGAITYQAEIEPTKVRICHCTDCQTLSGSPFRVVVATPEDNFTLLTGTPLYATSNDAGPRQIGLRVGAIRQRDQLVPNRQFWTRSAQPWLDTITEMPGVARQGD